MLFFFFVLDPARVGQCRHPVEDEGIEKEPIEYKHVKCLAFGQV